MADPSLTSAPVESNQDRGPALMAIFWTECAIALVVVSLRCHARILIRKIGKDDWIMFAAAVRAVQDFLWLYATHTNGLSLCSSLLVSSRPFKLYMVAPGTSAT